jgi:hypothetical protein
LSGKQQQQQQQQQLEGNNNSETNKMNELLGNTAKDGGFSTLDFRSKHDVKDMHSINNDN